MSKTKAPASPPAESEAEREATILVPDVTFSLEDGREVTVRELRYAQARRLGPELRPFIERMAALAFKTPAESLKALIQLPEDHPETFGRLLEASTGISLKDQEHLRDADGKTLEVFFWRVNQGFFARQVARYLPRNLAQLGELAGIDLVGVVQDAIRIEGMSPPANSSPSSPPGVTIPPV